MREWEDALRERELREKRRKAPGWLDSEERILRPVKTEADGGDERGSKGSSSAQQQQSLLDDVADDAAGRGRDKQDAGVDDLGAAMDRAFGRSEMG